MKRAFGFVCSVVMMAVSGVAFFALPAHAATPLRGTFVAHFGRGQGAPTDGCPAETFCGVGSLGQFGAATDIVEFTSFEPIDETPCVDRSALKSWFRPSGSSSWSIRRS